MFNIKPLNNEIVRKIDCSGCHDHVEVSLGDGSSRSCVILRKYMDELAARVKEMEIYEDDVWVVTFPKCGTTWSQEMVWLLNNDLDYKSALNVNLMNRFPFLELNGVHNTIGGDLFRDCENLPRPRHIKSHLPIFLLPNKIWTVRPKLIYMARNPKDAAVSLFHHLRHIAGYEGTKEDFLEAFLANQVFYAPFIDHVLDFWNIRHEPNILFLLYEDLKANTHLTIEKTMKFLGKNYSQEQIGKLCQHLSIDSMRANSSCNNEMLVKLAKSVVHNGKSSGDFKFIRKGKVGGFREELTTEMIQKFDDLMQHPIINDDFFFKRN